MTRTFAYVPAAFLALLSACAVELQPLPEGTTSLSDPDHGVVFGRIAVMRGKSVPPGQFGWWLTHADSKQRFVVGTLTEHGPFALDLPAGRYRVEGLMYMDEWGIWEGQVAAGFTVTAGTATYLGTWKINFAPRAPFLVYPCRRNVSVSGEVINELATTGQRPATGPVSVSLLQSEPQGSFYLVDPCPWSGD